MIPPELRPALTALALPPALPILLILLGLPMRRRSPRLAQSMVLLNLLALWLTATNGFAVVLAHRLLPQVPVVAPALVAMLKNTHVQAIVVLGGGMQSSTPEYGAPQLSADSLVRLRYGAWLAKQSGLPLAFVGGVGWASAGTKTPPEAQGALQAANEWGVPLRWAESESRDTSENAARAFTLLQRDKINQIVLVTHAFHMPRAQAEFESVGFNVTPAPIGLVKPMMREWLEWLPSNDGIVSCRAVLREWLGLRVAAWRVR